MFLCLGYAESKIWLLISRNYWLFLEADQKVCQYTSASGVALQLPQRTVRKGFPRSDGEGELSHAK